jgi:hypothetical protein
MFDREKTMLIQLTRATEHEGIIREFRRDICRRIGVNPGEAMVAPLPYAFYLLAYSDTQEGPVGMIEFFFNDDAFAYSSNFSYTKAYDLSQIGTPSEMIHVRSVIISENYRNSRLFMHLCASLLFSAWELGARHMTAATSTTYDYVLGLHKNAGMRRLGTFMVDGSPQQLSVLDMAPVAGRAERLYRRATNYVDDHANQAIVLRKSRTQLRPGAPHQTIRETWPAGLGAS